MTHEDLVKRVRARELTIKDCFELTEAGKRIEAKALMLALMEVAKNAPNVFRTGRDGTVMCYRRGKRVVQDKEGVWVLVKKAAAKPKR